jgi:hypothetical protein
MQALMDRQSLARSWAQLAAGPWPTGGAECPISTACIMISLKPANEHIEASASLLPDLPVTQRDAVGLIG